MLLEVPCGDEYSSCKFIKDAHNAQRNVIVIEQNLIELREEAEELYENIESLKPESIDRKIEKYESVLEMRDSIYNDINQNELVIDRNENKISTLNLEVEKLQGKIDEYEENREAIENLEQLVEQKVTQESNLKAQQLVLKDCDDEIIMLIKERGSLEQKLDSLISQQKRWKLCEITTLHMICSCDVCIPMVSLWM